METNASIATRLPIVTSFGYRMSTNSLIRTSSPQRDNFVVSYGIFPDIDHPLSRWHHKIPVSRMRDADEQYIRLFQHLFQRQERWVLHVRIATENFPCLESQQLLQFEA